MDLLPLTDRQLLAAKLQARLAAFLVWLAISLAVSASARYLMVTYRLVVRPPSLFDPWLIASLLLFLTLFVGTTKVAWAIRWLHSGVAAARSAALVLAAGLFVGAGYQAGYIYIHEWCVTVIAGFAAAGVVVVGAIQSLPGSRRLEYRLGRGLTRRTGEAHPEETEHPPRRTAWYPATPGTFGEVGLRGLGGRRGQAVWWLKRSVAAAATLTVAVPLLSIVIMLVALAWQAGAGGGALSGDTVDFCTYLPLLIFSGLIVLTPLAAWPEMNAIDPYSMQSRSPLPPFQRRHAGLLVPAVARHVWRKRLLSLLLVSLLMVLAGIASHLIVSAFSRVVGQARTPTVQPYIYWPFALAVLAAVWCFAFLPVLRLSAKTFELSGCLLWALFGIGAIGATLGPLLIYELGGPGGAMLPPLALTIGIAAPWTLLLLTASWTWSEPSVWQLERDGARSAANVLRAFVVLLAIPVTTACLMGLLMSIIEAVHR